MAQKPETTKPPRSSGSFFKVPSRALHKLSKSKPSVKLLSPSKAKKTQTEDVDANSNSNKRSISGSIESNNKSLKSESSKNEYEIEDKNPEGISSGAETCRSQVSYESSHQDPVPRSSGPVDVDSGEVVSEEKALFGKGNIHLQNGEYEKALETFYQILRNHNKEPSQLLASIYYNIGVSQTKLQSFNKALDAFHNSVRIYKKCDLMTHPNLAMTFVRLGFLHLESVQNYRKSLQAFHEALKIREIVYGTRHPLTAKIHNNLGVAYHHRKKYNRAKEHFQYALETQRYILAQLSHDPGNKNIHRANLEVANTLDNLGSLVIDDVHSADANDRKAALEAMEEAYQIRLERYGDDHPVVKSTFEKLEMVKNLDCGLIPSAPNYKKNPSIGESANTPIGNYSAGERKTYSPPPSTLEKTSEIINLDTNDDLIKSKNLCFVRPLEDGLNICHTPGKDGETSELLNDVQEDVKLIYEKACSSLKSGDYDKSLELYNSFLKSISSETNPLSGMAWHDIGIIHLREERFSDALLAFQKAVCIKRETLGNDHPDVAVSIVKVGIAQLKQDEYDLALESFDEALSMRSKFLGDLHPSTARIYNNIGCIHVHASRMSDARVAYEHALDIQRSAMAESKDKALVLESAMTLINLGILYRHQKLWKEAEVVLWEAYRLQRSVLGPNHMTVLSTLDAIADIMAWNNDAESALKYYKTVLRILRNHHRTSPRTRPACLLLYKMHRIYVSQNNIEAAWKCLSEARVLSKQCPELDERSYALEKKIAGEMEKMEEQSNICMTGSRQKDALNDTDMAIAPSAIKPLISSSFDDHDSHVNAIGSKGEMEKNDKLEKAESSSNIKIGLPISTKIETSHELNDTDAESSRENNIPIENSSNIAESNIKVENAKLSTNKTLEFSDAESMDSSKSFNQKQQPIEHAKNNDDTLQAMNMVQNELPDTIDSTNKIPDNKDIVNIKSEDSDMKKSSSFHTEDTSLTDSNAKEEGSSNRNESTDSRASVDVLEPTKADTDAPDKQVASTTPSLSSGSNSDSKQPASKTTTNSKYRSRMEALLASCATGTTAPTIDNNDSNSTSSESSLENGPIEDKKVAQPLRENQEFKSRLQSMISSRAGTNSARPWARSQQDTARPWARLTLDKQDDDSEGSDPLNDYSYLDRYDSTDDSDDNSDILNNIDNLINPCSEKKSMIPNDSKGSTNKFSSSNYMEPNKLKSRVSFAPGTNSHNEHDYESLKTEFDMLTSQEKQPNDYVSLKNEFEQLESGFTATSMKVDKNGSKNKFKNVESLFANRARMNEGNEKGENSINNTNKNESNKSLNSSGKISKNSKLEALFAARSGNAPIEPINKVQTSSEPNTSEKLPLNESEVNENPKNKVGKLEALFAKRSGKVEDKKFSKEKDQKDSSNTADKNSTDVPLKDDPKFMKYFKMLKVGMPKEVVKHAMTKDGLDPTIIDGDPSLPAKVKEEKGVPLKDDPRFAKYFKMLKVGMPRDAVKHSMTRDGHDPNILDGDPNLPAVIKEISETKPRKDKKKTRRTKLHWDSIREEVTSGSVWALVKDDLDVSIHIDDSEIKQLFEADIKSPKRKGVSNATDLNPTSEEMKGQELNGGLVAKRGVKKSTCSVKVIDPKRANNGGISLARIKISFEEIARVIDNMEKSNLTQQQFQAILDYLPTAEETNLLNKFLNGTTENKREELISTLCECEKFMVAMMNVQNAEKKIRALLFRLQFDAAFTELERDAALIDDACDELSNSLRLRKLLGIVLNVGNKVNMGAAKAFSITSLLKLNHTKSMDKKTTILHYVVTVAKRNDESLLYFKEDLPSVFKSEKVFWDYCVNGAKELEVQLQNVIKLVLKSTSLDKTTELCNFSTEDMEILSTTYLGQFVLDAVLKIKVLNQQIGTTNQSYTQLLQYFHEESIPSHEFFNIIVQFSRNFDSAKADVEADEIAKKRGKKSMIQPLSSLTITSSKSSNCSKSSSEGDVSEQTELQLKQTASLSFNSVLNELKSKAALNGSDAIEAGISEC